MAQQLASNPPDTNGIRVLRGVSQAQFLDYVDRHRQLTRAVAEASQERKDFLGKVKTEFGGPGYRAFLSSLKASDQPGEDREIEHLSLKQMMEWLNKPLGFQGSMFEQPDESKTNIVTLGAGELKRVDVEGEAAGLAGKHRGSNPWTPTTTQYDRWDAGWLKGQSALAATLKPEDGEPKRRGRPPGSGKNQRAQREDTEAAAQEARERGLAEDEETPDRVH